MMYTTIKKTDLNQLEIILQIKRKYQKGKLTGWTLVVSFFSVELTDFNWWDVISPKAANRKEKHQNLIYNEIIRK